MGKLHVNPSYRNTTQFINSEQQRLRNDDCKIGIKYITRPNIRTAPYIFLLKICHLVVCVRNKTGSYTRIYGLRYIMLMLWIIGFDPIEYNWHELYLGVRLQYIQYASLFSSGSMNFHPLAHRNVMFLPTIFIVCKIVLVMNISKIMVTGHYLCLPSILMQL
jgi:hypothetical protein